MALISKYPGKNDQYVLPLDLQTKVHIVDAADMAKMEHSGRYIRIDLSAAQLDAAKTIPAP
jgi:hypothetical protein